MPMLSVLTLLAASPVNARGDMKEMEVLVPVHKMIILTSLDAVYNDDVIDIDECASDNDNCDTDALCTNTPGSFTCKCKNGYEGDGITCNGI